MSGVSAESQPSKQPSSVPEADAKVTDSEDAVVPSVMPADAEEISRPSSIPDADDASSVPSQTEEDFEDLQGEDFFSYVLMLAIFTVVGILLWWAGVHKHIAKFRGRSTKTRGRYSKVGDDDVEKQMD